MSVKVTICQNVHYCHRHGLVTEYSNPCCCVENDEADECCTVCKGSGSFVEKEYAYSLGLSSAAFARLWAAMGLKVKPHGDVDGRLILERLKCFDPAVVVSVPVMECIDGEPVQFTAEISPKQVDRYVRILSQIAKEASKREENVCWF